MQNNPLQVLTQLLQMSNDPNKILQDLLVQNPRYQILINQMGQSGMSPRQFTEQLFRQNNVDTSVIQNLFNQRGIKL